MCASAQRTFDGAILDFCCGDGKFVSFLRRRGYNAVGFELFDHVTPRAPHFATAGWENPYERTGSPPDLVFDWASLRLPYADRAFNVVLSQEVFEHVSDHASAFRELARVTRDGGVGIHTFPSRYRFMQPHIRCRSAAYSRATPTISPDTRSPASIPMNNDASPREVARVEAHYAKWSLNYPQPSEILRTARRFFCDARFMPQHWEQPLVPWLYTRLKNVVLVVSNPRR